MVPDAGVESGPLVNGDGLTRAVRIKTKKMQFTAENPPFPTKKKYHKTLLIKQNIF